VKGPGLFVSIDGPGGAGKSTAVTLISAQLAARGLCVHATTEPTRTPLGELIRAGTDIYTGMALACLVAGDRHYHLVREIRPQRQAGAVVLCDRYLPSSLVLQRIDHLDWNTIWQLNTGADRPDLAVILNAEPAALTERMSQRGGPHSRFERQPSGSQHESDLYKDTAGRLATLGWTVCEIDSTARTAVEVAAIVTDRVLSIGADRSSHGS
jgi:dTMP kinase